MRIPGAGITAEFQAGETIWTECSHKYTRESLDAILRRCGFVLKDAWENRKYGFLDALYWLPPLSLVDA